MAGILTDEALVHRFLAAADIIVPLRERSRSAFRQNRAEAAARRMKRAERVAAKLNRLRTADGHR